MADESGTKGKEAKGGKCKCRKNVKETDEAMMCDGCDMWFHIKCIGMPSELYTAIVEKEGGDGLYWFCDACNVGVRKMLGRIKEVEEAQKTMEKELGELTQKVEMLTNKEKEVEEKRRKDVEKQGKMEKDIGEMKKEMELLKKGSVGTEEIDEIRNKVSEVKKGTDEVKESFAQIVAKGEKKFEKSVDTVNEGAESGNRAQDRREQERMMEMIERAKRRSNLILFGVPEEGKEGEGSEIVQDVINGLVDSKVAYEVLGRVGKKGVRSRPIRVKVENSQHRRRILTCAKKLKDIAGKENIYIAPDLTRQQQEEDKTLREEVRLRRTKGEVGVKISRGEVIAEKMEKGNDNEGGDD